MAKVVCMVKDGKTEKLSDVKSWTAKTVAGQSNFIVDVITTHSGPFQPGTYQLIAEKMQFKNIGEVGANANLKFGANTGSGWQTICSKSTSEKTAAGDCAYWAGYDPDASTKCSPFLGNWSCGSEPFGEVYYNMPDQYGATVNFAIKVWGADESEPPWPSLGMLRGRKTKARPAKAGLSGNQKAAVAGVTGVVVGGLVGYAVGRR